MLSLAFIALLGNNRIGKEKPITIKKVYSYLGKSVEYEKVGFEFTYYDQVKKGMGYRANFKTGFKIPIYYYKHADPTMNPDYLQWGKNKIMLPDSISYDPSSINAFSFSYKRNNFVCLVGKSASASGSGTQISYYTILSFYDGKVINKFFFDSRFGIIQNIGYYNGGGSLIFLKITNDTIGTDQFVINGYEFRSDSIGPKIPDNFVTIVYNDKDFFFIKRYIWPNACCFPKISN